MKLATPRWWYLRAGAPAPITRALLRPLSWIWAAVTARRIARTTPTAVGAPVICVGNVTLGGVGKTPAARELARRLGVGAVVLTTGYGGRLRGPVKVDPAVHTSDDVGDEALMLALAGQSVWVSRDRLAGARAAAAQGARAIVMDDGFQNPSVAKELSLVVVDGDTRDGAWPFGDGAVFPAGPMREPLAAGLKRADAVVLVLPADAPEADPELMAAFGALPVLVARLEPTAPPPPGRQVAFAGIGKPWKMERALIAAGCELVDFAPFPDHARHAEETLRFLARRAEQFGAGLVTSEKDWVRLPPAWRERVTPWPVRVRFEDDAAVERLLAPLRVPRPAGP
jgi:tetraacyldisaccharide 4'-kinase